MSYLFWIFRVILISLLGSLAIAPLILSRGDNSTQNATTSESKPKGLTFAIAPPPQPITPLPAQPKPEAAETESQENKTVKGAEKPKNTPTQSVKLKNPTPPPFDLNQSLLVYSSLFATPVSWGMVAIGLAEGNYRLFTENGKLYVQQTSLYYGHTDPGNLSWGERVTNYGPCSDQGRSGGNIALAEKMCLERALSALPTQLVDLYSAGINPNQDIEALINTADLYNQASPIHSRRFPQALTLARRGGKKGVEAIAWARTASFYLNDKQELDLEKGTNRASGLLGICIRENRPVTEWHCVYADQMRRVQAVNTVVQHYKKAQTSQSN